MHIGHFTNTYHPSISGVVRSVSSFRDGLSKLGHNVFIFTQDAGDFVDSEPFIFRYLSFNLGLPNDFPATIPFSPYMERLIPELKLDLIHTHHPVILGQIAANKAEELDIPLVFTFHTRYREYSHYLPIPQEIVQEFVKGAIDTWLKEYIKKVDHVIVPSESMRIILENQYGHEKDTTVVSTGIDLRPYHDADGIAKRAQLAWGDDRVIISVSRLGSEKNWSTLIHAVALVIKDFPKTRLAIIGDGPQRKRLQKLCRELGIAERVDFLGKLPFEDIPQVLKAADLFTFASITETQGLVTLEAMAAGLPVVAVDAVGTHDVVENEKDGLLTENNAEALAESIKKLLMDESVYQHYKEAAAKKAHSLEYVAQAEKLLEVYEQVLEHKESQGKPSPRP